VAISDFSVEDAHAVVAQHDPALTRVEVQGDWLRVDVGRPARGDQPGGTGQTVYLYRYGPRGPDGQRRLKSTAGLRAELAGLLVDEFKLPADAELGVEDRGLGSSEDPGGAEPSRLYRRRGEGARGRSGERASGRYDESAAGLENSAPSTEHSALSHADTRQG
jgi:hypothetical protein